MGLVKYRFRTATALVEEVKVELTNTKASKILFDSHSVHKHMSYVPLRFFTAAQLACIIKQQQQQQQQ